MRLRRRVAIVGGGPAGAHCARRLAERGLRVTVFEPRLGFEKACGGGIPERGLRRFPFLVDARLPGKAVRRCLLVAPSGFETEFDLPEPLHVFGRGDLHTFLLDRARRAGAVVERARVVHLGGDRAGGPWTVRVAAAAAAGMAGPGTGAGAGRGIPETTEHGPFEFLVAADGAAGFCRRRLSGDPAPRDAPASGPAAASRRRGAAPTQGLGYYLQGVSEDRVTLKFYPRLDGYLWVFPRLDHSSAGICGTLGAQSAANLRDLMDGFLRPRYGPEVLARAERFAALIPSPPDTTDGPALQGPGWALAGDAGGFVDPLTREGIHYALLSADLLAEALADGRPGDYAARWRAAAEDEFSRAGRHRAHFFQAAFTERLVRLASASRSIARILGELISGSQPYGTLKRRLLLKVPRVGIEAASAYFRSWQLKH